MQEGKRAAHANVLALGACFLTMLGLGGAWHVPFVSGIWIGNAAAAVAGISLGLWSIRLQGIRLFAHFRRDAWHGLLLGFALVAASHLVARLILRSHPLGASELDRLNLLLEAPPGRILASPLLVLVVLAEELVFRGAATTWLAARTSPQRTVALSTLLYVLPLLMSGSWLLPLVGALLGSLWTYARLRYEGLWVPLVSHVSFSLALFVWLPA